jgi:hypothetical protein
MVLEITGQALKTPSKRAENAAFWSREGFTTRGVD